MLVSIIIPVHKTTAFFKICVESAIEQTHTKIEIIIACNGTLDVQECQEFLKIKDLRIIYLKTKEGRHNARNEALQIAKGDFIQFLDYDDVLFLNKFSIQLQLLQQNSSNVVLISQWKKFQDNIEEDYNFPFQELFSETHISTGKLITRLGQTGGFLATVSWIVSSDLIKEVQWTDSPNDDAVFFSEICKKSPNIYMCPKVLAGCRIHHENTSSIRSNKQYDLLMKGWKQICNNLEVIENSNVNLYLYKAYLFLISYSKANKRYRFYETVFKCFIFGVKSRVGFSVFFDLKRQIFN